MQLLSLDEAMAGHPRYYRVTVLSQWIMVFVFGAIVGWLCWLTLWRTADARLAKVLLLWMIFWLGLFWFLMLNDLRKALKASAWLAATDDSGLFIRWRSYQNLGWGLSGRQVVFLSWREIRRARRVDATMITPEGQSGRRRSQTTHSVEFDVAPRVELDELRGILAAERDGRPDGVKQKTKWGHFPVTVEGESTIRVEWRARPSLHHFMEEMAAWVEVGESASSTTDVSSPDVTDQTLGTLARQGSVMGLIAALRHRDGLSLVEAKERAERMIAEAGDGGEGTAERNS